MIFCYLMIRWNFFPRYTESIRIYNYYLLIFNLLPIYPLDGGKLINLLVSNIYPYKKSLFLTIYFSYIFTILLLVYFITKTNKLNLVLLFILLMIKIIEEDRKKNYIFEKFLLERYLKKINYHKIKKIRHIDEFMRNKRHILYKNGQYYSEREILRRKFEKRG